MSIGMHPPTKPLKPKSAFSNYSFNYPLSSPHEPSNGKGLA